MKVLIISDLTGGPGGVYRYLQNLETYKKNVIVARVAFEINTKKYVEKNYFFKHATFIPLSHKFHQTSVIIKNLKKILVDYNPDVVHVINGSIKSNLLIREYLINHNISFLTTESLIERSVEINDEIMCKIRYINKKTEHVVYLSEENQNIALKIHNIVCKESSVIYNAVNTHIQKKELFSKKPFRFYTVARCVPQKGIDVIIKALSMVTSVQIHFDVFGDGPARSEYEKMASCVLGDSHCFRILGWYKDLNPNDVIDYDLFVLASREEGLSHSVLEAATLGMPIICSNASGNSELVEKCGCGELFNIEDFSGLSEKISNFLLNPKVLQEKTINAISRVDNFFNIEIMIVELEKIYVKIQKT